jgi:hypothetical protein
LGFDPVVVTSGVGLSDGHWMYQVTYNKYLHIYMYTTIMYETHSEKLMVTQLVKKHPAFYGTRRFITVFTRAH